MEQIFQQFIKKVPMAMKSSILVSSSSKPLSKKKNDHNKEVFFVEYEEKIFMIKLLSIKFNSQVIVLVMVNDATESIKLKVLEDTFEYKTNLFSSFSHEFKTH